MSYTRLNMVVCRLTGQFANKPARSQSSQGLVNSRTSQLNVSEFLKIMELTSPLVDQSAT